MTTLENSYCVPRTVEEWDMLYPNANWMGQYPCEHSHVYWHDNGKYLASWPNEDQNKTEIPVPRFIDLLHDRICPWRVEEAGFDQHPALELVHEKSIEEDVDLIVYLHNDGGHAIEASMTYNTLSFHITTFTDLLTLIRMLTPPSK